MEIILAVLITLILTIVIAIVLVIWWLFSLGKMEVRQPQAEVNVKDIQGDDVEKAVMDIAAELVNAYIDGNMVSFSVLERDVEDGVIRTLNTQYFIENPKELTK